MANYVTDLMDFDSPSSSSPPPATFGSIDKSMASSSCRSTVQSDSFASLPGLVKAKKPWTSIPLPTPKPSMLAAPSDMQYAKRIVSPSSILSPTARPLVGPQSVAAYIDERENRSGELSPPLSDDLETRFNKLSADFFDVSKAEHSEQPRAPSPSPSPPSPASLLPGFVTPPHIGHVVPPTPKAPAQHHISAYDRTNVPVVRVTKESWESMRSERDALATEKRDLEKQLDDAERSIRTLRDQDNDAATQIGRLRYQNEANRNQKATMGRAIAERDEKIKDQELDIANLRKKILDLEVEIDRRGKIIGDAEWLHTSIRDNEVAHAREIDAKTAAMQQLQERMEQLTHELEEAKQGEAYAQELSARVQNEVDVLSKKVKNETELRYELVQEQNRAMQLEDEVERLREQVNQGSVDELKAKLSEKSSQCDRFRTELKKAEHSYKIAQQNLIKAHNGGETLSGGAHLVVPNERSKLPRSVIACSECYALNLPCDNDARCGYCALNGTQCARWRCSMKHKLGECRDNPCKLPHDTQGWLVRLKARPEW